MNDTPQAGTRLNKYLASAGVASRRGADQLVFDGHVTVNGEPCLTPGYQVQSTDHVKVDGRSVRAKSTLTIVLNKQPGYVTTKNDELGRKTVYDLLPPKLSHLNHVGRLDQDSEGLLIFSNDGLLANQLTHPKEKVEKEYLVTLNQPVEDEHLEQFLKGVFLEEGRATAKAVTRISGRRISMVLDTGMKRQVRLMCRALGYQVKRLIRIRIGAYTAFDLEPGESRELLEGEMKALLRNPGKPGKAAASPKAKKETSAKPLKGTPRKTRPAQSTKKSPQRGAGNRATKKNSKGERRW